MSTADIFLTIANVVITVVSAIAAYKSVRYFRKSRFITIYAQSDRALGEIGEMLRKMPRALEVTSGEEKGVSPTLSVQSIGTELADHFNVVLEEVSSDYSEEFRRMQKKDNFDISSYFNSLIDGSAITENGDRWTLERKSFDACQERLREMQEFLKQKMAETAEQLK